MTKEKERKIVAMIGLLMDQIGDDSTFMILTARAWDQRNGTPRRPGWAAPGSNVIQFPQT